MLSRWHLCGLLMVLLPHTATAQQGLPILRANSRSVDVQDGDRLRKGVWIVDPSLPLDVYCAGRTSQDKRVSFVSDVDSIAFDTEPDRVYDFIILLGGKDACHTQISRRMQPCRRVEPGPASGPDEIPITISHGKLHLQGKVNASRTLDLLFDTGADTSVLYPSALELGATLEFDGKTSNTGTGGTTLRQTASDNRLELAGLRWDHEPFLFVEKQADVADGIVGFRVFEDKVLEIDYDRMLMLVHDELPASAAGFTKIAMQPAGTITSVDVTLSDGHASATGPFCLDTGGTGALMVNQAFAAVHGLPGAMKVIGSSESRGVGSGSIRNQVVLAPALTLAGFTLPNVPIHVELPTDGNSAPPGGALCMDVLERFNAILDYPHDAIYLRPDARFGEPFESSSGGPPAMLLVAGGAIVVALAVALILLRAKRRRAGLTGRGARARSAAAPRTP